MKKSKTLCDSLVDGGDAFVGRIAMGPEYEGRVSIVDQCDPFIITYN